MSSITDHSKPATTKLAHIKALDGMRALSILLVLATHALPLGFKSWQLNEASGLMGMSIFFALSGFLIISLLSHNADAISFLVRRLLRIVPAMALYVLAMVLLFGITGRAVLENALFITNYNFEGRGDGTVDAPMSHLWSLSVEVQFYIAMGLAALVLGKRCIWLVIPAAIYITSLRVMGGFYTNIATHLRVDEILSGGILALVTLHYGPALSTYFAPKRRALLWIIGVGALWFASSHPLFGPIQYGRPYFAALLLGVVIHSRVPVLHDILEGRIAGYIAKVSFALYIWHPLMIWGWMNDGTLVERYLMKRPVSFALAFAAAHISTFWWEARWQVLARKWTRVRVSTVAP